MKIPAQSFSIWGHYDVHEGRLNGLGVRYNGNTSVDNTTEYITHDYTLVDAQMQDGSLRRYMTKQGDGVSGSVFSHVKTLDIWTWIDANTVRL